jgi:hypothetical protein
MFWSKMTRSGMSPELRNSSASSPLPEIADFVK